MIPRVLGGIHFRVLPLPAYYLQFHSDDTKRRGFERGNEQSAAGHAARWGTVSKHARTGAGAPVPTPRSPRARRFRRIRPLSCTPYRAGASDTATPAVLPAANVMETDDTTQPMQPPPPEVLPRVTTTPNTPMRMARTHARTTCTRLRCGAGCFGGFCCTDRALHVGRAAACLTGPADVCACHCTHPPHAHAPARSLHRPGRCLRRGDAEVAANAGDADGSASEDAGSVQAAAPPHPSDETAREPEVCRTSSRA